MKSEFASLSDLALASGITHSDLIVEIHSVILNKFRQRYPQKPLGIAVVVDEITGTVRLFSGEKDITPEDFVAEAASLARQVIIDKLSSSPPVAQSTTPHLFKTPNLNLSWISNFIFWAYNIYFFLSAVSLQVGLISSLFVGNLWENLKKLSLLDLLTGWVLLLVPLVATWFTFRHKLYSKPGAIGKIFFLFELPVFLVCLIPGILGQQISFFVQFVIVTLMGVPLVLYFYSQDSDLGLTSQKILLFIEQIVFVVTTYLTLLFSFFVPLIIGASGKEIFSQFFNYSPYNNVGYSYYQNPSLLGQGFQFGFALLLFLVVALLIFLPYLLVFILTKAMRKTHLNLAKSLSPATFFRIQIIYALVILVVFAVTSFQSNATKQLDLLASVQSVSDFSKQEKIIRQLLPDESKIAKSIRDYSQIKSKYWLTKSDTSLSFAYMSVFDFDAGSAQALQDIYLNLAYPFVYQGKNYSSYDLSSQFNYVFGHFVDQATTSPASSKLVKLSYRSIKLVTDKSGLAANVSIEDEFENTSPQQQEVVYEFSLPVSSVVTSLRLGPDLEYLGIIAPKGAAQKTYQAQIQIRRDPALLEQIGPNQYRLRVYPVPGVNDYSTLRGRQQKVQFTYVTPISKDGFVLPEYSKTTNLFASSNTTYLLQKNNESPQYIDANLKSIAWDTSAALCQPSLSIPISLPSVAGRLESSCISDSEIYKSIYGKKIALLIDVSSANKDNPNIINLKQSLSASPELLNQNTVDLYKYNQRFSDAISLTNANLDKSLDLVFFGPADFSQVSQSLSLTSHYDLAIILPSPGSNFANLNAYPFNSSTSTYILEPAKLPVYDLKFLIRLFQGGGGEAQSLADAVRAYVSRSNTQFLLGKNLTLKLSLYPEVAIKSASGSANIFPSLINSQIFKSQLQANIFDAAGNIVVLDQLNTFSKDSGIVTPVSSLIALVNEQQQQQLDQFSDSYNRYQDETPIRNPVVVNPVPMFDSTRAMGGVQFGKMANPFVGNSDMVELSLPGSSSVNSVGALGGVTATKSIGTSSFSFGQSGFMIINGLVFGLGLLVYLIKLIKRPGKSASR